MRQALAPFRFLLLWFILSGAVACSKKDQPALSPAAVIENFSLFPGKDRTQIDASKQWISIRVPDSVQSGVGLAAQFTITPGTALTINGEDQVSGKTINNFENDLHYTLTASDPQTDKEWTVQASNNDYSVDWGLGHFINSQGSNDRNYNWYIDQATSGNFASVNCGPASVTMAIKWADSTFTKTALDARMTYETSGGWWYTNDIDAYLTDNQIDHGIVPLAGRADSTSAIMKQLLVNQQIIILCLDMNYVRPSADTAYRIDKFYNTTPAWGHFIVVKGYKITDGEIFFETYDPFSFGLKNDDQTLKGMNRYYRFDDLAAACLPWWNYVFVVAKKGESLSLDAMRRKLDISHVPSAHNTSGIFQAPVQNE